MHIITLQEYLQVKPNSAFMRDWSTLGSFVVYPNCQCNVNVESCKSTGTRNVKTKIVTEKVYVVGGSEASDRVDCPAAVW